MKSNIAAEQKVGADTSALEELKGRMESAKSEAAQARPDVETQTKRVETERNMTRAVSTLTNLPAGVQTQADAGAARQALYDYLKADEGGKAAAQSKATEQLKKSISAALEANGLDAGTRQRLERMLDNIDSKGEMGDNKAYKYDIKKANEAWKLIDGFRTETNGLEPLGENIPKKGDNKGTVALIEVNGEKVFGVNSTLLSNEEKNLGRKYFAEMQRDGYFLGHERFGQGNSQVLTHAEGYALLKAYEMSGGKLGEIVIIYTDRATCGVCQKNLLILKEYLHIKHLIIINKNGKIFTY